MKSIWSNTPTWIKAIIYVIVLLYPILIFNQSLIINNLSVLPSMPWALFICLCTLWLFWQFCTGASIPFGASEYRKHMSSTQAPPYNSRVSVLSISIALFLFVYAINAVGFGLFGTDQTAQLAFIKLVGSASGISGPALLLAAALTAGVVEEIVFRGYIQRLMTIHYGVIVSFIFVAIIFTIGHLLPPELYLQYFLVSIAFSWVAHCIGSIVPGIIVHILFDFSAFLLVRSGSALAEPSYLADHMMISSLFTVLFAVLLYLLASRLSTRQ